MRILLLSPLYPPVLGGAELQAQRLARDLASRGAQVTILTQPEAGTRPYELDGEIAIVRGLRALRLGPLWGLTYMASTARWVRRLADRWDVLHAQQVGLHCWPSVQIARSLAKHAVLRFACSGPGGDLAQLSRQRCGARWVRALAQADRLVALTQGSARELCAAGLPGKDIRVIPNGVDDSAFPAQEWPTETRSPLRLLFVGRLHEQKGIDILLRALARAKRPDAFMLRLIGEGPERERLATLAASLGLGAVVRFEGSIGDLRPLYAWSEVVVLPSRFEGMPNVVLEGMASARPVIGTRIDGTADILEHSGAGWLVASEDPDALAGCLEGALHCRSQLPEMGAAGRRLVAGRYAQRHVTSMYLEQYQEIMSRQDRLSSPRAD